MQPLRSLTRRATRCCCSKHGWSVQKEDSWIHQQHSAVDAFDTDSPEKTGMCSVQLIKPIKTHKHTHGCVTTNVWRFIQYTSSTQYCIQYTVHPVYTAYQTFRNTRWKRHFYYPFVYVAFPLQVLTRCDRFSKFLYSPLSHATLFRCVCHVLLTVSSPTAEPLQLLTLRANHRSKVSQFNFYLTLAVQFRIWDSFVALLAVSQPFSWIRHELKFLWRISINSVCVFVNIYTALLPEIMCSIRNRGVVWKNYYS